MRVGLFFGGVSVENEISVITASQVYEAMKDKYDVVPLYIAKDRHIYIGKELLDRSNFKRLDSLLTKSRRVTLQKRDNKYLLVRNVFNIFNRKVVDRIDVAISAMHGTYGEDGALAGMLDLVGIPYGSCGLLSSALCMDKITTKAILAQHNIASPNYHYFYSDEFFANGDQVIGDIEKKLNYPIVVKPSNIGSSIGISVAKNKKALQLSIEDAAFYSRRVIVEEAVQNLVEVNVSVIGDKDEQLLSESEQVFSDRDILTFEDKYITKNSKTSGIVNTNRSIPANISEDMKKAVEEIALKTFKAFDIEGLVRIDMLVDSKSNIIYVNEINSVPGSLAFYLWEPKGVTFPDIIDKLIEIAVKRERKLSKVHFTNNVNILGLGIKGKER